jgi:hypothetical protein
MAWYANTEDVAEGAVTALDPQKPPVNVLCRQGAQMVIILKITLVEHDTAQELHSL